MTRSCRSSIVPIIALTHARKTADVYSKLAGNTLAELSSVGNGRPLANLRQGRQRIPVPCYTEAENQVKQRINFSLPAGVRGSFAKREGLKCLLLYPKQCHSAPFPISG